MYADTVISKQVYSSLLCPMPKAKKKRVKGARAAGRYADRLAKLGKRIKELRKKRGYDSALDFALDKNISVTQMARWETGKKNITFESQCLLADAFGMTLSELLEGI